MLTWSCLPRIAGILLCCNSCHSWSLSPTSHLKIFVISDRSVYIWNMTVLSKSERTRSFIIEKAAPLFNKKGYAGTSMSDIMVATGLAKGGVYGNFESKDEIAAAAFEFSLNKIRTELLFTINQHSTALGKLFAILAFY